MGAKPPTLAEANAEADARANVLAAKKEAAMRMYSAEAARVKTPGLSKAERTAVARSAAAYAGEAASYSSGLRQISHTQREGQSLQTSVVVMGVIKAQAEIGARIGKTIDVGYIEKKARKTAEARTKMERVKEAMTSDADPDEEDESEIVERLLEDSEAAGEFREHNIVHAMPSVPTRPVRVPADDGESEAAARTKK